MGKADIQNSSRWEVREVKQNAKAVHWRGINPAWGKWGHLKDALLNMGRISNRRWWRAEIAFSMISVPPEPNGVSVIAVVNDHLVGNIRKRHWP